MMRYAVTLTLLPLQTFIVYASSPLAAYRCAASLWSAIYERSANR